MMIYRAAFSKEVALEVEPGYWTWHCNIQEVKSEILNSVDFLKNKLNADNHVFCLSDDKNFRRDLSTDYKDKRTKVKRPLVLKPTREWLLNDMGAITMPSLEGDDVLGILQTSPHKNDDTIIVSGDKDMKSVPGKVYREDTLFEISEEEANHNFFTQVLTGDITDGYTGIPGVGPAKALKILGDNPTWDKVLRAYEAAGLSEEEALLQAWMARILRYEDYDHENKQPIMWKPR